MVVRRWRKYVVELRGKLSLTVHYSSVAHGLFVIILNLITATDDNSPHSLNGGLPCRRGSKTHYFLKEPQRRAAAQRL